MGTFEKVVYTAVDSAQPLTTLAQGPLSGIDKLICKSLDLLEQRIPSMYLPPEMVIMFFFLQLQCA